MPFVGSTVVVYGLILLALSQSHIRANWRVAGTRDEVARAIDEANTAVDEQRVERALEICSLLDSKANADEKKKISDVRTRVEAIKQASRTTSANSTVIQLVEDGRRHIAQQKLDDAQSALKAAIKVPMATDFSAATQLANEIVVGNALANINGLEAGGTWKFNASTFGTDFSSYKFNELTGL